MYNEENSSNTNSNLSTELSIDFTQDQTNMSLPNLYNNPSMEWSTKFNQDQTNNNVLTTELSIDFTQYQTNISLPNTYNNPSIEQFTDFSQNQPNNNLTEWTTDTIDFTNNSPFMEWGSGFTPYQINTNLLNIFKNSIIELPVGVAQNNEDQINHDLSIEQTEFFTQDQTNTNSLNIHNSEITQCHENNTLQQYNAKSVKENKRPVSLVSRRKKYTSKKCEKCNLRKPHYDEYSNQCKDCYRASLRVLSEFIPYNRFINIEYLAKGGFSVIHKATWVDGPIARWNPKKQKYGRKRNFDVALKVLNNSNKMDSDYLNELKNFFHCIKNEAKRDVKNVHQYIGITQHPETKNYIIVIEFAQNRDLHHFLNKNANSLSWIEKLKLLQNISYGLEHILNGLRPKIPIDIPHELVKSIENCWHPDPDKRIKDDSYYWGLSNLSEIINKAEGGEIKFSENKSAIISPNKMNEQGIYSSRPLTPLISKALTLQSMKLNSNAIT
ncbi:24362_t:CDS:2, partial [Cetraspora pellucida]